MPSPVIAKVYRGETVESIHRGNVIVLNGDLEPVATMGDPDLVTFARSSVKAFQAIPFIASGAADAFGFTEKEIALACASHSGEPFHTRLAVDMLGRGGFTVRDLKCGAHPPFDEGTARQLAADGLEPSALHNNCSGKHSAMLAFAKHIGADPAEYLEPESPVQQTILETISKFSGVPANEIRTGTDGCSAPNFAMPLRAMATAYARLIDPPAEFGEEVVKAARRIVAAKTAYPEYVGGSVRLDTKIMQALKGKIVCKVGAEGVWLAGILPNERWPKGLAVAMKIDDGNDDRARPAAAIELLRHIGLMTPDAEEAIGIFSPMVLKNRRDIVVGRVEATLDLTSHHESL